MLFFNVVALALLIPTAAASSEQGPSQPHHSTLDVMPPPTPGRQLIVGGQDAAVGRFPYFVRIDDRGRFLGCGGTLIAVDFVLTAGHCIYLDSPQHLTAVVGAMTRLDSHPLADTAEATPRQVLGMFRHPAYIHHINDVGLLRIEPMPADTVTVALNRQAHIPAVGQTVTTMGCGFLVDPGIFGSGPATVLQQVDLQVMSDSVCDHRYHGHLHAPSMVCATAPGKDSCNNDSGGPLIIMSESGRPEDDVQVGLVSWGMQCASRRYPGVYAEVSYDTNWIDAILCDHSVAPPVHCPSQPTCHDHTSTFYVSRRWQHRSCEWLVGTRDRFRQYCQKDHRAWLHCPFTCHGCTDASYEQATQAAALVDIALLEPIWRKTDPAEKKLHVATLIMLIGAGILAGTALIHFLWKMVIPRAIYPAVEKISHEDTPLLAGAGMN